MDKIRQLHSSIKKHVSLESMSCKTRNQYEVKQKCMLIYLNFEWNITKIQNILDIFLEGIKRYKELIIMDQKHKTIEIEKFVKCILLPARCVTKSNPISKTKNALFSKAVENDPFVTFSLDNRKIDDFFRVLKYALVSKTPSVSILLETDLRLQLRADFPELIQEMDKAFEALVDLYDSRMNSEAANETLNIDQEPLDTTTNSDDIDSLLEQLQKNQDRHILDQSEFMEILQNITDNALHITKRLCIIEIIRALVKVKNELSWFIHLESIEQKTIVENGILSICQIPSPNRTIEVGFDTKLFKRLTQRLNEMYFRYIPASLCFDYLATDINRHICINK